MWWRFVKILSISPSIKPYICDVSFRLIFRFWAKQRSFTMACVFFFLHVFTRKFHKKKHVVGSLRIKHCFPIENYNIKSGILERSVFDFLDTLNKRHEKYYVKKKPPRVKSQFRRNRLTLFFRNIRTDSREKPKFSPKRKKKYH